MTPGTNKMHTFRHIPNGDFTKSCVSSVSWKAVILESLRNAVCRFIQLVLYTNNQWMLQLKQHASVHKQMSRLLNNVVIEWTDRNYEWFGEPPRYGLETWAPCRLKSLFDQQPVCFDNEQNAQPSCLLVLFRHNLPITWKPFHIMMSWCVNKLWKLLTLDVSNVTLLQTKYIWEVQYILRSMQFTLYFVLVTVRQRPILTIQGTPSALAQSYMQPYDYPISEKQTLQIW